MKVAPSAHRDEQNATVLAAGNVALLAMLAVLTAAFGVGCAWLRALGCLPLRAVAPHSRGRWADGASGGGSELQVGVGEARLDGAVGAGRRGALQPGWEGAATRRAQDAAEVRRRRHGKKRRAMSISLDRSQQRRAPIP